MQICSNIKKRGLNTLIAWEGGFFASISSLEVTITRDLVVYTHEEGVVWERNGWVDLGGGGDSIIYTLTAISIPFRTGSFIIWEEF